jgi:hypothetical protein
MDIAFEGKVVVEFALPNYGTSRAAADAKPGFATTIVLDPIMSKTVTIQVIDGRGWPIEDALVVTGERITVLAGDVMPESANFANGCLVEKKSVFMKEQHSRTDAQGRVRVGIKKCNGLLAAVARVGIVGKAELLWTGEDLPVDDQFVVRVERAPTDSEPMLLMRGGTPLANVSGFTVSVFPFCASNDPDAFGTRVRHSLGDYKSDDFGRIRASELTIGCEYHITCSLKGNAIRKVFKYQPGMTIEF